MTRTLIFAGLAAVSLLISSCFPILGHPSSHKSLVLTTAEELEMVKKEADNEIMLTARKVNVTIEIPIRLQMAIYQSAGITNF